MPARKPKPEPQDAPRSSTRRKIALPQGQQPFVPTEAERQTVAVMAAAGLDQEMICGAIGSARRKQARIKASIDPVAIKKAAAIKNPSTWTLKKYFRDELASARGVIFGFVLNSHMKRIEAGDMNAIKWFEQAQMGWRESILVDDGKPADQPMRVIIEYVGEAGPPRVEASAPRTGSRLPEEVRRNVQLVG
jgi:hypothetical protein